MTTKAINEEYIVLLWFALLTILRMVALDLLLSIDPIFDLKKIIGVALSNLESSMLLCSNFAMKVKTMLHKRLL